MFFWNSLAFSVIQRMLAIWSLVPMRFLNPAWTPGSSQFTYYWSLIWRVLSHSGLAKMLLQFLRHIFHFHQEFYWAMNVFTVLFHYLLPFFRQLLNSIFPKLFIILRKESFKCLLQSSREWKNFPLRYFCTDWNKWKCRGTVSGGYGGWFKIS